VLLRGSVMPHTHRVVFKDMTLIGVVIIVHTLGNIM